jgi:tryptophan-rich sensory protein
LSPAARGSVGAFVAFIVLCIAGGLASGLASPPGEWYASLAKPSWTPPGWLFGPVWTVLYAMIGVAGWRLWRSRRVPGAGAALGAWSVQLALNFAWTPVFFGLRAPAAALAIILVLLASILATVALAWRVDRPSSLLLLPYTAWVCFATALNAAIVQLN